MGLIGSDDFGKYFSEKFRKSVKLEKRKIPRNCSGRKSDRNHPTVGDCAETSFFFKKWGSSEVVIWKNSFGKKFRKSVKFEKRKSLVIVAGGNQAEIRPTLALVQSFRFSKMGLVGSP